MPGGCSAGRQLPADRIAGKTMLFKGVQGVHRYTLVIQTLSESMNRVILRSPPK